MKKHTLPICPHCGQPLRVINDGYVEEYREPPKEKINPLLWQGALCIAGMLLFLALVAWMAQ